MRPSSLRLVALAFGLLVLATAGAGCGGCGSALSRTVDRYRAVAAGPEPAPRSADGEPAVAGPCPASHPVECAFGCCEADTVCGAGDCVRAPDAPTCPGSRPIRCGATLPCRDEPCGPGQSCEDRACRADDASPRQNHARVGGPATSLRGAASGRFGGGASLNYSYAIWMDCRAEREAPGILAPTAGFPVGNAPVTLEAWFWTSSDGVADDRGLLSLLGYGTRHERQKRSILLRPNPPVRLGFDAQGARCLVEGQSDLREFAWHFVAAVWDGATASLYLDGALLGSCGSAQMGTLATPAGTLFSIGNDPPDPQNPCYQTLNGRIDEVRVLDYAADAQQIAADYSGGPLQPVAGTVGLWHLDEGLGAWCCAPGEDCGPDGACLRDAAESPACPSGAPVACGDGRCCRAGTSCSATGCTAAFTASAPACPPAAPVSCGSGRCCEAGWTCGAAGCERAGDPGHSPADSCPPGTQAASPYFGRGHCCPRTDRYETIYVYPNIWNPAYQRPACPGWTEAGSCVLGRSTDCPAPYTVCNQPPEEPPRCMTPAAYRCAEGREACLGGCCDEGHACSNARCCPVGTERCGSAALCCPTGTCNAANDGCTEAFAAHACPEDEILCGGRCCPAAVGCIDGECRRAPDEPECPPAFPVDCDDFCCPAGATCGDDGGCELEPDEEPDCGSDATDCDAGGCCPEGFECGTDECRRPDPPEEHEGPQGPECGEDRYCDEELECAEPGLCCPDGHPVACGLQCCPDGSECAGGLCSCPSGGVPCGEFCCNSGMICGSGGRCERTCRDPQYPTVCGDGCCAALVECRDGVCQCPSDHPVTCQDGCCLAGAACTGGVCGCPAGRAVCATLCCAEGDECRNGACVEPEDAPEPAKCPSPATSQTCPDGASRCCEPGHRCCRSAIDGKQGCLLPAFCE